MAAPAGISHKVQAHFEKCIRFSAASAPFFSSVFSLFTMKKKKTLSQNTFVSNPLSVRVMLLKVGNAGVVIHLHRNIGNKMCGSMLIRQRT